MASGTRAPSSSDLPFDWQQHLGLLIGAATALYVCLKLFGVALWDQNTAFAVLSENGTATVVTGSVLTLLPLVLVPLGVGLLPKLMARLETADRTERWGLVFLAAVLTVFVGLNAAFPLFVLGLVAASVWLGRYLHWTVKVRRARRELQEAQDSARSAALEYMSLLFRYVLLRGIRDEMKGESSARQRAGRKLNQEQEIEVARIEERVPEKPHLSVSANIGFALTIVLSSLALPWLPPEIVDHRGESETVFVLNYREESAVVLFDSNRSVRHIDADLVEGRYCKSAYSWLTDTLLATLVKRGYPVCPASSLPESHALDLRP